MNILWLGFTISLPLLSFFYLSYFEDFFKLLFGNANKFNIDMACPNNNFKKSTKYVKNLNVGSEVRNHNEACSCSFGFRLISRYATEGRRVIKVIKKLHRMKRIKDIKFHENRQEFLSLRFFSFLLNTFIYFSLLEYLISPR